MTDFLNNIRRCQKADNLAEPEVGYAWEANITA